jgi:hydroxypyruvate isomerase
MADFGKVNFASGDKGFRDVIKKEVTQSVEVAKRVGATWTTVVPGRYDQRLEWDYQTANVIENLRYAAEICEKAGLIVVLEPLNPFRDHPGLFLTKIPQAYLICRAVKSPSCKILFDIYHAADHGRQSHPEHRQGVGRNRVLPNRRQPGSQRGPERARSTTATSSSTSMRRASRASSAWSTGNSQGGVDGERAVVKAYREADNFR